VAAYLVLSWRADPDPCRAGALTAGSTDAIVEPSLAIDGFGDAEAGLGLVVALRTYFDRPTTEAEIDRQVARLQSRA